MEKVVSDSCDTDHSHVEHVERLRFDCTKETMEKDRVKDRMEDFFGGLSFKDLNPEYMRIMGWDDRIVRKGLGNG